jgi:glycosyltransferase involved in cell wall biosynthesis
MKLAIYSRYFPPSVGGVETVVNRLASGLAALRDSSDAREFQVTLITQTPRENYPDDQKPFRIVRQPSRRALRRLLSDADVVHIAGAAMFPIVIGLLLRKPVVVEHHSFQPICPSGQLLQMPENIPCPGHFMAGRHSYCLRCQPDGNRAAALRPWLLSFVRRFLCKRVTVNLHPTAWLRDQLQLPHALVAVHGLPVASQIASAPPAQPPLFVYIGRVVSTKGIVILLEAARALLDQGRSLHVVIIGDGPERLSLQSRVREWGLDSAIKFAGCLSDAEVDAAVADVSAIVIPSLGGEVFGLVVAENMLRGVPIVASNLGSFAEVLGGTGRTFQVGDGPDLARAMAAILDDPATARAKAQAARQRVVEEFPLSRMIDEHAALYRRLCKKHP